MITNGWFWLVIVASVIVYWMFTPKWRDSFLFLVFGAYIATLDWKSAAALLVFATVSYVAMQTLDGRYKWLTLACGASVFLYLAYFKYLPPLLHPEAVATAAKSAHPGAARPAAAAAGAAGAAGSAAFATSVLVPLGASYFTFKLIHYVIECHRKHITKHGLDNFLAYMFFLPMFTAGPIERFDEFQKNRTEKLTFEHVWRGGTRIIYGLVKKFVIVDMFMSRHLERDPRGLWEAIPLVMPSYSSERMVAKLSTVNPLFAWQFVINHFITWYIDFSAYTDIAIGLGLLYGVKLCENFDWPFLVTNIGDFWKRYHMSLSNWAQRYVYFPLLGSTRNAHLALFATMLTIGLWHAGNVNYIAWGAYQAVFLSLHLVWTRYKKRRLGREEDDSPFAKLVEHPVYNVFGWAITSLGVCASAALPSMQGNGILTGLRLMGVLVGIHVN